MIILILSSIISGIITTIIVAFILLGDTIKKLSEQIECGKQIKHDLENQITFLNTSNDDLKSFIQKREWKIETIECLVRNVVYNELKEPMDKLREILKILKQDNKERLLKYVEEYFDKEGKNEILKRLKNYKEDNND